MKMTGDGGCRGTPPSLWGPTDGPGTADDEPLEAQDKPAARFEVPRPET